MREYGSVLLYVHGNHQARYDGQPSTFTQLTSLKTTANKPQPHIPVLFFFSDGVYERKEMSPLAFSRALAQHLFVTSEIISRKRYVKD